MALGVTVTTLNAPPPGGPSTDTGTLFIATDKATTGPLSGAPDLLRTPQDLVAVYGARAVGNAALYDYVDAFLHEGGSRVFISRFDTGGAAPDSISLDDALDRLDPQLGPGQVVAITDDADDPATWGKLLDHAAEHGRVALLDVAPDANTTAELEAAGGAFPAQNADYGGVFGPWAEIPAPAGITGVGARQVPASAIAAALINRADQEAGHANRAAAGRDFPLQYATGFVYDIPTVDVEDVLDAGVNPLVERYGVLQVFGFQTGVEQDPDNPYWQLNCSRERMSIIAKSNVIGEGYAFKNIDGKGKLIAKLAHGLEDMLLREYEADALFGGSAREAFAVTITPAINTTSTIAQGELHAVAEIRPSLHAKSVQIQLVTVPVTGQV
jgi:hypothetical protein